MKLVAFLLLSSLTIVIVVAFPDGHITNADLSSVGHNANSISATNDANEGGASPAAKSQTDDSIRQPRGLLKKILGYPERVVVVEKVYVPQNPVYSGYGYSGYGSQYAGYGRRY